MKQGELPMKSITTKVVSAALAASLLASGTAALPASAEGILGSDSGLSISLGGITDEKPVISESYKSTAKYVSISWDKVTGASGYRVYRKADGGSKFKLVAEISGKKNVTYKDTDVKPNTRYAYKVKAFKGTTDRQYSKGIKALSTVTAPEKVKEITKVWGRNSIARLKWTKQSECDGYIVYYYTYDYYTGKVKWKKAAVIDSPDTVSARIDISKLSGYSSYDSVIQFCVKSYSTDAKGGIKTAAASSKDIYCNMESLSNQYAEELQLFSKVKKGESKTTFTNENTQPKKSVISQGTMTDNDKKAIEKFAKRHFQSNWSDEQKVLYTLYWINRNVTYDTEYKHIRPGYADSIFEGRWGQCAQYNGALIEMMSYLGYDATLILGYRGSDTNNQWQHFWGEVEINKKKYVMETGNFGKNGGWMYFCTSYKYAGGYIKNKKVVEK